MAFAEYLLYNNYLIDLNNLPESNTVVAAYKNLNSDTEIDTEIN